MEGGNGGGRDRKVSTFSERLKVVLEQCLTVPIQFFRRCCYFAHRGTVMALCGKASE